MVIFKFYSEYKIMKREIWAMTNRVLNIIESAEWSITKARPSRHLLVHIRRWKHQNNVFKIKLIIKTTERRHLLWTSKLPAGEELQHSKIDQLRIIFFAQFSQQVKLATEKWCYSWKVNWNSSICLWY